MAAWKEKLRYSLPQFINRPPKMRSVGLLESPAAAAAAAAPPAAAAAAAADPAPVAPAAEAAAAAVPDPAVGGQGLPAAAAAAAAPPAAAAAAAEPPPAQSPLKTLQAIRPCSTGSHASTRQARLDAQKMHQGPT
ncbi:hypothetical protein WJX74_006398 [Apatococcus lobatus]|uniref:Uncharacterized protein n=1 Tax=Apatococcus lobatus TaxID=904363 RepID=A0AAW1QVP5_9CHLO